MAKNTDDAPVDAVTQDVVVTPVPAPGPQVFPQTVDEFCAELSATDRRPELIYAFACDEKRAGRVNDLAFNFLSRLTVFANRPV